MDTADLCEMISVGPTYIVFSSIKNRKYFMVPKRNIQHESDWEALYRVSKNGGLMLAEKI